MLQLTASSNRRRASAVQPPVHLIRATLASRVATSPLSWLHASSAAGVSGTDAFLIHLGRSVTAALESVEVSAEAAQAQLQEARASLHAAIDARCDELGVKIDSTKAAKVASLESELVGVEAALVLWRSASSNVLEALSLLPDTALEAQYASLSSDLDEMEAQLKALPTSVIETPLVGLLADAPLLLTRITSFGHVLAPLSVTAADLTITATSSDTRVSDTLRLRLSLGARHTEQCAEELELLLGFLIGATSAEAILHGCGVDAQSLRVVLAPDAAQRCLVFSAVLPRSFSDGAPLSVAVCVAGQPVSTNLLNLSSVRRGISPKIELPCQIGVRYYTSMCISSCGRVYCPPGDGPAVLVYDADGTSLPGISVASLGLPNPTTFSAFYDHTDVPSLLLSGNSSASSHLVAVDPVTRAVRWTATVGRFCSGIVVLPSLGAAVVNDGGSLVAHRLSDGSRAGSLVVPG